jgi:hypothetical protein
VYGLLPRFVGALYVIGFGTLIFQHESMPGSGLYLPNARIWAAYRRDFPGIRRYFEFPSLLWIFQGEAALRAFPYVGVLAGIWAIIGGPYAIVAFVVAWMLWLSLESRGVVFPWDTMLVEIGFLVFFLPSTQLLPDIRATELPLPSVSFMVRWLVIRLMIGFGKEKFIGTRKTDMLYLRGFFVWMPLPTPLAWIGHHAPAWMLRAMLVVMFFAEIAAPVLGLFTGDLRLIAFASLVFLMIGIQATGNWGFFNIGYILLCVSLLDVNGSIFDLGKEPWASHLTSWPDVAIHALMGVMFLISLVNLPNNSFLTRSWLAWPPDMFGLPHKWMPLIKRVHALLTPLRWIWGFRFVNGYGVFPPHAMPPLRLIPVFEGSDDGVEWKAYGYRFMPTTPKSRPPVIAPYHARFDQYCYYTTMGIDSASLFGSLYPLAHPYAANTSSTTFDLLVQRILAGDKRIRHLFPHDPFPNAPPKLVRVSILGMTPTRIEELRRTGDWWHVRRFGTFLPPRGRETWPEKIFLPEPELFHPDFLHWKRRAKPLRDIVQAFHAGVPFDEAAITGSDLTREDIARFWNEFVPELAQHRGDLALVHTRREALLARFGGVEGLHKMERVLERFSWLLQQKTDAFRFGQTDPGLPVMSNYRYHLFLNECVSDGREAYAELLAHPERAIARAERTRDEDQLWALFMLRYERVMNMITACRYSEMGVASVESGMPGIFEYHDLIVQVVPPGEEFCPRFVLHPNGEHTIEGFYPPPPAHSPAAPGGMFGGPDAAAG